MPRKIGMDVPGGLRHVMGRGISGPGDFFDDQDRAIGPSQVNTLRGSMGSEIQL